MILGANRNQMRIAIATFYQAVNAGAYLQQFALRRVVEEQGFEVEILRYKSPFARNEFRSRFHRASGIQRITSLTQVTRFWRKTHRDFRYSDLVKLAERFEWSRYAAVIFGSDEIWNVGNWFSGYCPILFGQGVQGARKISYAPSFGEISNPAQLPAEVAGLLREFHSLSVRDENSAGLVRSLTGREANLSLDPTLVYDFEEELKRYPSQRSGALVVYATHVGMAERKAIAEYAAAAGMRVMALGFPQTWADSSMVESHPLQTLAEFRAARAVYTNTFHGTALACKFNRPFVLGALSGKHNKVASLLKVLQFAPVQPTTQAEWAAGFAHPPSAALPRVLEREKERSLAYLRSALAGLN